MTASWMRRPWGSPVTAAHQAVTPDYRTGSSAQDEGVSSVKALVVGSSMRHHRPSPRQPLPSDRPGCLREDQ